MIRVRRADDVGDAVLHGDPGHLDRVVFRHRAIIQTGEEMMVNINHESLRLAPAVAPKKSLVSGCYEGLCQAAKQSKSVGRVKQRLA